MEMTLSWFELALICWAVSVIGVLVGWFLAAACTCGKVEDLERENYALRATIRQGRPNQ